MTEADVREFASAWGISVADAARRLLDPVTGAEVDRLDEEIRELQARQSSKRWLIDSAIARRNPCMERSEPGPGSCLKQKPCPVHAGLPGVAP